MHRALRGCPSVDSLTVFIFFCSRSRHCLAVISDLWIGAYAGSPARLSDDFSTLSLILCTFLPVLFPLLLEDASRPSWDKNKKKFLPSMMKVPHVRKGGERVQGHYLQLLLDAALCC